MKASFEEWSKVMERLADIAVLIGNEARDFLEDAQYESETTDVSTLKALERKIQELT